MAIRACVGAACLWLCMGAVGAEEAEPLSVIEWMSDSVLDEPLLTVPSDVSEPATTPSDVRVMRLDAPVLDAAGLVSADALGVSDDLWGRSSAAALADAVRSIQVNTDAPPSLVRFYVNLLEAELAPPLDAAVDDRLFFARVDRLLELGHLETAQAVIEAAPVPDVRLFRRLFDVALLMGTETEACREIEARPELSPTYPTRIFCLARLGQFDVAALTLGNAETLGILSEEEEKLLLLFLDPELFEEDPVPPAPTLPTPLEFRLYEAVGARISTEGLPVAFAFADLANTVGWKARLSAAERLTAAGALPFQRLLDVYRERGPSASGGVWDRLRAATRLTEALEARRFEEVAEALSPAWRAAQDAGYTAAFADWMHPFLKTWSDPEGVSHVAFEIALFAGDAETAGRFANASAQDQFLLSIANDAFGTILPSDPLERAVLRGLSAPRAGTAFETLLADDRQGEVLLRALGLLVDGADGNPNTTAQALTALRRLELGDLARQVAIELILKEGVI